MRIESPYHEGELRAQQRAGEVENGKRNGRAIADTIVKGAFSFIEQQPMVVLGSVDPQADIWASVLVGRPGFLRVPDERTVEFDLAQTARNAQDPFWVNIDRDPRMGMLLIELSTRRRFRINGRIVRTTPEHLSVAVDEAYPNCPKYIQRRHITRQGVKGPSFSAGPREGHLLEPPQQTLITSSDTFFVASGHPARGVDVSHRGGKPGFIRVLNNSTLRIPDYTGNSMYNTLGNFTVNPRAGLVFLDFERSQTLQLIGRPEILWELDDPQQETGGTKRYWDFHIERWLQLDIPHTMEWDFLDYSPHNPS